MDFEYNSNGVTTLCEPSSSINISDNYYKIDSPRYVFNITENRPHENNMNANELVEEEFSKKEYFELKPASYASHNYMRRINGVDYNDIDRLLIEELISEKNILDYDHEIELHKDDENSLSDEYFDYYGPVITVESINWINGIIIEKKDTTEVEIPENEGVYPYKCTSCKSGFKTSYDLITHFEDLHKSVHLNYIRCIVCDAAFETADAMKDHMQNHKNVEKRPYACRDCGKRFKTLEYCRNHEDNKMCNASEFICKTCGKEFPNNYGLVRHGIVHTNERPLKCTLCPKGFRNPNNLELHMRWHNGEKPFKCNLCPKEFGKREHFDRHRKNHNDKLQYICKICERAFKIRNELDRHMHVHLSKKRYECPICTQKFLREEKLKRHLLHHTTLDENIKCRLCEQEFTAIRYLLRHMTMRHRMKILTTLSTHLKPEIENNTKPKLESPPLKKRKKRQKYDHTIGNYCELCKVTFKTPRYLGKHRKTMHSDIYPDSDNEVTQGDENSNSNSVNNTSLMDESSLFEDNSLLDDLS